MNNLKMNYAAMEFKLNEKGNEILDLKVQVEVLEEVVKQIVSRVDGITRRSVKQTPTPSPSHKPAANREHPVQEDLDN